jgi:prepilin-type N-terminal cleavage/methylation domain-containing protein
MSRLRAQNGFTVIELLVSISISTISLGAVVTAFVTFVDQSAKSDRRANSQDAARRAMDVIATEVRSAMSTSQSSNQPIEDIRDYSLTYLPPVHDDHVRLGSPRRLVGR